MLFFLLCTLLHDKYYCHRLCTVEVQLASGFRTLLKKRSKYFDKSGFDPIPYKRQGKRHLAAGNIIAMREAEDLIGLH